MPNRNSVMLSPTIWSRCADMSDERSPLMLKKEWFEGFYTVGRSVVAS